MRIGITGTHGVGKTTLLDALLQENKFRGYHRADEVTRWVHELGININEQGSDASQQMILMRHVYNLWNHPKMITDRTLLDSLVYTDYLYFVEQRVSLPTFKEAIRLFEKAYNRKYEYDYTIYIKPEFALVDDGVRSVNQDFQKRIFEIFETYIDVYNLRHSPQFIEVSGSTDERVKQVLRSIAQNVSYRGTI